MALTGGAVTRAAVKYPDPARYVRVTLDAGHRAVNHRADSCRPRQASEPTIGGLQGNGEGRDSLIRELEE